jgi:hypothetical protein
MRVLLQDAQTGLYLGEDGGWVSAPDEAREFPTPWAAAQTAPTCDRDDVNVVLKYEDPDCQLVLNPAYCPLPPLLRLPTAA